MNYIEFFVPGIPAPAGSKSAFAIKRGGKYTGRVKVVDACKKSRPWKDVVSMYAKAAVMDSKRTDKPWTLATGAVEAHFVFYMPRPACHYGTGQNAWVLKPSAPKSHIIAPDCLKLARAAEDALTRIVYMDDRLIRDQHHFKRFVGDAIEIYGRIRFSKMPGVLITIRETES